MAKSPTVISKRWRNKSKDKMRDKRPDKILQVGDYVPDGLIYPEGGNGTYRVFTLKRVGGIYTDKGEVKIMDEMRDYPPGEHDDRVDASRLAFDSIINRHLFLTRLAYRVPFFILEVFLIALFTLALPVGAGWVLVAGMEIIQPGYPYLLRLLGYWLLGAVTIGGVGITAIGVTALWSALKDATVRLLKLIRERKQAAK